MSMGIRQRFSERLTLEAINGNCLYCKNLGFCLSGFQLRISRSFFFQLNEIEPNVYNFFFAVTFVLVGEHHVERNISNLHTFVEKYVKWGNTACTSISASIDIYLWECTM